MFIDTNKIQTELALIRHRIEDLRQHENELIKFLEMATLYKTEIVVDALGEEPTEEPVSAVPIAEIDLSKITRRNIVAQAVASLFSVGEIVTARDVYQKIGDLGNVNPRPIHVLSNLLMHERHSGGIFKWVGPGRYQVKSGAQRIVETRIAADIAEAHRLDVASAENP